MLQDGASIALHCRRRLCGLLATRPRTTDSIFGVVLGQPLQFLFGAFDRAAAAADNIGYILDATVPQSGRFHRRIAATVFFR